MKLTFIDSQERFYSDLDGQSLHAIPGETYELSADPGDNRWSADPASVINSLSAESGDAVSTVPEADSEPAQDVSTQSSEQGA